MLARVIIREVITQYSLFASLTEKRECGRPSRLLTPLPSRERERLAREKGLKSFLYKPFQSIKNSSFSWPVSPTVFVGKLFPAYHDPSHRLRLTDCTRWESVFSLILPPRLYSARRRSFSLILPSRPYFLRRCPLPRTAYSLCKTCSTRN